MTQKTILTKTEERSFDIKKVPNKKRGKNTHETFLLYSLLKFKKNRQLFIHTHTSHHITSDEEIKKKSMATLAYPDKYVLRLFLI